MQGKPVFTHAVKNISAAAKTALEANGKTAADVDWVVAHQANLRILEGVADRVRRAARQVLFEHPQVRQHVVGVDSRSRSTRRCARARSSRAT